jgi:hypothetical protein
MRLSMMFPGMTCATGLIPGENAHAAKKAAAMAAAGTSTEDKKMQ